MPPMAGMRAARRLKRTRRGENLLAQKRLRQAAAVAPAPGSALIHPSSFRLHPSTMASRKQTDTAHQHRSTPLEDVAAKPYPELDAIGITALAKAEKADPHRNLLVPGTHEVYLNVWGEIDHRKWARTIRGNLVIGCDAPPAASSSTPWEDLLQSALCPCRDPLARPGLRSLPRAWYLHPIAARRRPKSWRPSCQTALKAYRSAPTKPASAAVCPSSNSPIPIFPDSSFHPSAFILIMSFPYLIISDVNAHLFTGQAPKPGRPVTAAGGIRRWNTFSAVRGR